jgi:hypothetical protein
MKHIKTFESYSLNEEEGLRKFFTGHDSSEDRDKAMIEFNKALAEAEADVNKNPEQYVFNKEALLKAASENNYLGGLRIQVGGRDKSRYYVVYDQKSTGWNSLTSAAGSSQPFR